MSTKEKSRISDVIKRNEEGLLADWLQEQDSKVRHNIKEVVLREQCAEFLQLLNVAYETGLDIKRSEWDGVRKFLAEISRRRGEAGFSPSETATFVFSLKRPLFTLLRKEFGKDAVLLADETWNATLLLDGLGLYTTEVHQKTREEVIARQQQDMLELSTPVVNLADNILALPLIGTLDSSRTQVVMESLLQKIVESGSTVAIIDITGVPTVDTLVAQHLLKTVTAARLMGADCIISGIRPQIAQTIVHLGVDLGNVITKATLASAFKLALERNNLAIMRTASPVKHKNIEVA